MRLRWRIIRFGPRKEIILCSRHRKRREGVVFVRSASELMLSSRGVVRNGESACGEHFRTPELIVYSYSCCDFWGRSFLPFMVAARSRMQ